MIVKISRDRGGKSRAASARAIVSYITRAEKGERPLHIGSTGLFSETVSARAAEIAALAQCSIRSKNPVSHVIFSWPEGERPTPQQADAAARIFLREVGMEAHQAIWALHDDTRTRHLHLALNRVDPVTERAVKINGGFDVLAAHRAVAVIEQEQGWEPQGRALFVIDDHGQVVARVRDGRRRPVVAARDFEHRTGERSAQRIAIEDVAPLIRAATSWGQLHAALAERGVSYIKRGSGALIVVGETPVKASSADRAASLAALTKRLGAFEPAQTQAMDKAPANALEPALLGAAATPELLEYRQQRAVWRRERTQETGTLLRRQAIERERLKAIHAKQRTEILRGDWRNRGEALKALRAAVAAAQRIECAEQQAWHRAEREHLRDQHPPLPGYEAWLRLGGHAREADAWRERLRAASIVGMKWVEPRPLQRADSCTFEAVTVAREVHYRRKGRVEFIDRGRSISIAETDETAILAALKIGREKWGEIALRGSMEFRQRAATIGFAHGIPICEAGQGVDLEAVRRANDSTPKPQQKSVMEQALRPSNACRRDRDGLGL